MFIYSFLKLFIFDFYFTICNVNQLLLAKHFIVNPIIIADSYFFWLLPIVTNLNSLLISLAIYNFYALVFDVYTFIFSCLNCLAITFS